ncbi:hypothetical protein ACMFAW_03085 [Citrobacter koseri]|uniref:hypothetical protein n=1 Tax=Citrobacter koseri TaxID=545 RepID=UPI003CFACE5B
MAQLHGVETIELTSGTVAVTTIQTAIIGLVGTAPDASDGTAASGSSGFGSREDRSWVVESLVFSLTPAGFSYTYNLVVDIRRPAKSAKKSGKDKNGPDYFG